MLPAGSKQLLLLTRNWCKLQRCVYVCCVCVCACGVWTWTLLVTWLSSTLQVRRTKLDDTIRQFGLFRECDEVESWIKEKVCSYTRWSFVLVHNMGTSLKKQCLHSLLCMAFFIIGGHRGNRRERWGKGEGGSHAEEVWCKSHALLNNCLPCWCMTQCGFQPAN